MNLRLELTELMSRIINELDNQADDPHSSIFQEYKDNLDDEDAEILEIELKEPDKEIREKLEAALEVLESIFPILTVIEDFMNKDIGTNVFKKRWELSLDHIREKSSTGLEIGSEVSDFLSKF